MYFVVEVTSDGSARQSSINLSEHGRQKRDEGTEEQSPLSRARESLSPAGSDAQHKAAPPSTHTAPAPTGTIHAPSHNPSPLGRGTRAPGAVPMALAFDAAGAQTATPEALQDDTAKEQRDGGDQRPGDDQRVEKLIGSSRRHI